MLIFLFRLRRGMEFGVFFSFSVLTREFRRGEKKKERKHNAKLNMTLACLIRLRGQRARALPALHTNKRENNAVEYFTVSLSMWLAVWSCWRTRHRVLVELEKTAVAYHWNLVLAYRHRSNLVSIFAYRFRILVGRPIFLPANKSVMFLGGKRSSSSSTKPDVFNDEC